MPDKNQAGRKMTAYSAVPRCSLIPYHVVSVFTEAWLSTGKNGAVMNREMMPNII